MTPDELRRGLFDTREREQRPARRQREVLDADRAARIERYRAIVAERGWLFSEPTPAKPVAWLEALEGPGTLEGEGWAVPRRRGDEPW